MVPLLLLKKHFCLQGGEYDTMNDEYNCTARTVVFKIQRDFF